MKKKLIQPHPLIMAVLNITPDSFSDGGRFDSSEEAINYGLKLLEHGADIIDIGGESTRPDSKFVSEEEELNRVIPVIQGIMARVDTYLSIDTTKPGVAKAALLAGAKMINDVSTLRYGDQLATIARDENADLLIMHSRKYPKDMQDDVKYQDVVNEVCSELMTACDKAINIGVPKQNIWLDPGIGFAKTAEQNLEIMANLNKITTLGFPVLVGPSRKSFIAEYTGASVNDRLGGTAAAVAISVYNGAHAVRVHDVSIMRQAAIIAQKTALAITKV